MIDEGAAPAPRDGVRRVLGVFAHPDDEVLCAGGTLRLCAELGQAVTVICATRGEYGPVADEALVAADPLPIVRERELRESCASLGVRDVRVLGLPDAGLEWAVQEQEVFGAMVRLLRTLQPEAIITFGPDGLYGHPDHVAIGDLVVRARAAAMDAALPAAGSEPTAPLPEFPRLFFPVITEQSVARAMGDSARAGLPDRLWSLAPRDFRARSEDITVQVDVSAVLDHKLRALRCHRTQLERDNLLSHLSDDAALRFLGIEGFRCADGRAGDPRGLA